MEKDVETLLKEYNSINYRIQATSMWTIVNLLASIGHSVAKSAAERADIDDTVQVFREELESLEAEIMRNETRVS